MAQRVWPGVWGASLGEDALDLGSGVVALRLLYGDAWIGLVEWHTRIAGNRPGERCGGYLRLFELSGAEEFARGRQGIPARERWRVMQWDPLTLREPLACYHCAHVGHIHDGAWIPGRTRPA